MARNRLMRRNSSGGLKGRSDVMVRHSIDAGPQWAVDALLALRCILKGEAAHEVESLVQATSAIDAGADHAVQDRARQIIACFEPRTEACDITGT